MFADGPDGKDVGVRADKVMDALKDGVAKLGLQVRAGVFHSPD